MTKTKNKQKTNKLSMRPFKKYVTCITVFFNPFIYLPYFVNFPSVIHQTSVRNYRSFSLASYIKGGKKSHLQTELNF